MAYRYAQAGDFTDLAAGRVLRARPGHTAFPVRLASELAQRALAYVEAPPVVLDPCCGGGYLLTVVGFLHGARLRGLVGSDIDPDAAALCTRNLALLDADGLDERAAQLHVDLAAHGKQSHRDALTSAERLRARLPPPLERRTFVADAADAAALRARLGDVRPELVLTDVPYGERSAWRGGGSTAALLSALAETVAPRAVVALATAKPDRPDDARYERLERWRLGHRLLTILRLR